MLTRTARDRQSLCIALAAGIAVLAIPGASRAAIDLQVSSDGHQLERKDNGAPFLWLATTQYLFASQTTREQASWALQKRKDQGFSVLKFELWDGEHPEYQTNAYGESMRLANQQPNPAFFQHVDYIVDTAQSLGMYLLIVLNKNLIPGDRTFYEWLGSRYRDRTNIFWCTWSGGDVQDQAEGLARGLTGSNLSWTVDNTAWHTFFLTNYFPSPEDYWTQPWSTLKGSNKPYMENISQGYASAPAKPVVITDGSYNPGETTDESIFLDMRNRLYQVFLSGGYYTYGFMRGWEGLSDNYPADFELGYDSPGASAIKVFSTFFRARNWNRFVPDNTVLSNQPAGTLAMRASDGAGLYVYFSGAGTATVSTAALGTRGAVQATWFNTVTGAMRQDQAFTAGGSVQLVTPSEWKDALWFVETGGGVIPPSGSDGGAADGGADVSSKDAGSGTADATGQPDAKDAGPVDSVGADGRVDVAARDGSTDGGTTSPGADRSGGCGCRAGLPSEGGLGTMVVVLLTMLLRRRRVPSSRR